MRQTLHCTVPPLRQCHPTAPSLPVHVHVPPPAMHASHPSTLPSHVQAKGVWTLPALCLTGWSPWHPCPSAQSPHRWTSAAPAIAGELRQLSTYFCFALFLLSRAP